MIAAAIFFKTVVRWESTSISLSNRYPQTNDNNSIRIVQLVQIKKKYLIIEMAREAIPKEINKYKIHQYGVGILVNRILKKT